jgi:hypothetical protein
MYFFVSPLYPSPNDKYPQYNMDYALQRIVELGADKEKIIVGIPCKHETFIL